MENKKIILAVVGLCGSGKTNSSPLAKILVLV